MQSAQNEVCPSCGVVLAAHVPRCPACGFLLAAAPGPVYQNSIPPKRPRPAFGVRSNLPTAIALGGVGVTLAIALVGFLLMRERDNARAALPAVSALASAPPPPSASAAPAPLEPTTLFAKAKSAALAWHTDATLIQIDLAPVTDGKVAPSGELVFTFGKPAGKKLGPGTAVQATGFEVHADASGVHGDEHPVGKAVSVAEPNCIFEDVIGKIAKTAVAPGEPLHFRYAMNERGTRGVWHVTRVGETETLRTLDGANCAIIVH